MARIFQFPATASARRTGEVVASAEPEATCLWRVLGSNPLFQLAYGIFIILIVITWPLLRWLIMIDLGLQLMRMLLLWGEPGIYAGLTCLLHFSVVGTVACLALFVPLKAFK